MSSGRPGRPPRRLSDPITMQEMRGARTSLKNEKKKRKLKKGKTVAVPEPADADEGIADVEAIPLREITPVRKETERVKKVKEERKNEVEKNFDVKVTNENEKSGKKKKSRRREEKSMNETNHGEMKKSKDDNEEKSRDKTDSNKAESKSIKEKRPRKSSFKQKSFDEDVPDGGVQSVQRKSVTISTKGDETFLIPPNESSTEEEEEPLHGILKNRNPPILSSDSNDSTNSRIAFVKRTNSNDSSNSSRGGQPEGSKRDSMRSITSSYMTDVGDDDDELSWLKNLLVIKILFVDIFASMGDHITDFMQGFNLMFDFSQLTSFCHYWRRETWSYGTLILAINWSPGLVAALHLLAYHRKEIAAENSDEPDGTIRTQIHKGGIKTITDEKSSINVIVASSKSEEEWEKKKSRRWKKFLLTILLCLFFYPIVPAIAYFKILWWWNVKDISSASFQRAEKTAHLAHSITGGFEAPVQLILTLWLIMRGVFDNPISTVVKGELPKDRFGNNIPLPAIPLLSIVFSICSIILASIRLNKEVIPLPRGVKISKRDWFRLTFTTALSRIPFYLCSILFKISSFAFQWIFLDYTALFPNLVSWFINLCIGYYYYSESKLPRRIKRKIRKSRKEYVLKKAYKEYISYHPTMDQLTTHTTRPEQERILDDAYTEFLRRHPGKAEYEERTEQAVWLSSFIGLFLPCCYSQNLDMHIVENMKTEDYKDIIKHNKEKQNIILRRQQFFGTFIHVIVILAIWILVNFESVVTGGGYAYNYNKFTQNSFNIFCVVMLISGLMNLGFCFNFDILDIFNLSNTINYDAICRNNSLINSLIGHGYNEDEKEKKRNIFSDKKNPLKQIAVILLGVLVVVLPFVLGYGFNAMLPPDNGFVIIRPNEKAPGDKMRIDITKMFSVNAKAAQLGRRDKITGIAQTCKNFHDLNDKDKRHCESTSNKNDTILIIDFTNDASCFETRYTIGKKFDAKEFAAEDFGAVILLENWKNRATSPYKNKIGKTTVDFNDGSIGFPIVTVRYEDVDFYNNATTDINCKRITIVFDDLEQQLEKETSPLFHVDCDLGNKHAKISWKDKEECPNKNNRIFFARVEEETAPVRCIDVTIRCHDKGLPCNELIRYQGKWDDKQERISETSKICETIEETVQDDQCKTNKDDFKEIMPLVCTGRDKYHALEDLLCGETKYLGDEIKFWDWNKDWNDHNATQWCCDDSNKIIMFSNDCGGDETSFGNHQEDPSFWSHSTEYSTCTFDRQGDTLSKKSYRFKKFNLPEGCILIEETQVWCEKNIKGVKTDVKTADEYKNVCEKPIGEYNNIHRCKNLMDKKNKS